MVSMKVKYQIIKKLHKKTMSVSTCQVQYSLVGDNESIEQSSELMNLGKIFAFTEAHMIRTSQQSIANRKYSVYIWLVIRVEKLFSS